MRPGSVLQASSPKGDSLLSRTGPGATGLPEGKRWSGYVSRPRPLRVFGLRSRRKPELAGRPECNTVSGAVSRSRPCRGVGVSALLPKQAPPSGIIPCLLVPAEPPLARYPAGGGPLSRGLILRFSRCRRHGRLSPRNRFVLHPTWCKPFRVVQLVPKGLHYCLPSEALRRWRLSPHRTSFSAP